MARRKRTGPKGRKLNRTYPRSTYDGFWKSKEQDLPKEDEFYSSREWLKLRMKVLEEYECKCMACGQSPKVHGIVVHVDHIKPRSTHPKLELVFSNLQLLCEDCNMGKGNRYKTDYRP